MKNLQTFAEFINESNIQEAYNKLLESEVNEKRVSFKGKTVNDLYKIVKDDSNSIVFANGKLYSVLDPEEMKADLKNDSTYVYDKDGGEHEVKIADIEFIEIK